MEAVTDIDKGVVLCYKQKEFIGWKYDADTYITPRFVFINKYIDYEQEEVLKLSEVKKRIKELSSFSNRNYHSFTIKQIS